MVQGAGTYHRPEPCTLNPEPKYHEKPTHFHSQYIDMYDCPFTG